MHPDGLDDFVATRVAAGDTCSVAIDAAGQVRCWGLYRNSEGNFGFHGPVTDATPDGGRVFRAIGLHGLAGHRVVDVACGQNHTLALTDAGRVIAWGVADQGQLGRKPLERRKFSSLEPEALGLRNIVAVATGSFTSFAVDKDGRVFAWGLNAHRQTGVAYDDLPNPSFPDIVGAPTLVHALDPSRHDGHRVVSIRSGEHFSLFLFDDGSVWSVGRADDGQCGLAADHPSIVAAEAELADIDAIRLEHLPAEIERVRKEQANWPTELPEGEDPYASKIKLREAPDAQDATARMNVWNRYERHQRRIEEPQRITFPAEAGPMRAIGAGLRVGMAVSRKGQLYSWGMSVQGALGLGSTEMQDTPALVTAKSFKTRIVLDIDCGGDFNHALTTSAAGPFPEGYVPPPAADA